ncbi:hypothetical protein [Curvivirga aplysinae]|uniref:hypothetical protein n=1 Tax=Curvivirga aplysinae TaxID=2529852 RepID=UPI0012BCDA09|nr:hypothetical protein [Curvivirga aplysinae]MTI10579.1 hypothetical protein [Curvivirga aplysinae]
MDYKAKSPTRKFTVKNVELSHVADINLDSDELITFQSSSGKELDITAKDWGYYLTGSTNGRMKKAGYRTVLSRNPDGLFYVLAYETEKQDEFTTYLASQDMEIIAYLDQDDIQLKNNIA